MQARLYVRRLAINLVIYKNSEKNTGDSTWLISITINEDNPKPNLPTPDLQNFGLSDLS